MFGNKTHLQNTDKHDLTIQLAKVIQSCDAVMIGAGSGLSTSAGLTYSGERFEKYFSDFIEKYQLTDMYTAGFYPFKTLEEYWAYWSRHIYYNRYIDTPKDTYELLLSLVKTKDYFVLTTNVDHQFQKAGFDKTRLFYTQGDYGLWQCSKPCHHKTYDNEETVKKMILTQENMRIPFSLIPRCPKCGAPMTMNLRSDNTFVQDDGWYQAANRYEQFIRKHRKSNILYLELGVGANTPVIIKYPFWNYTYKNEKAVYACINLGEAICPEKIRSRAILIDADIHTIIGDLLEELKVK